jgi:predicted Zn-ribbon and HTH transcriptional regulator
VRCQLCGFEFEEGQAAGGCAACSLRGGCGLIRCPNCGYEWPREPEWLARMKKLWRKEKDGA